jgi:hypothetical protein
VTADEMAFWNTGPRSGLGSVGASPRWPARCRPVSMRARSHSPSLRDLMVPRDQILHNGFQEPSNTLGVPVWKVDS